MGGVRQVSVCCCVVERRGARERRKVMGVGSRGKEGERPLATFWLLTSGSSGSGGPVCSLSLQRLVA